MNSELIKKYMSDVGISAEYLTNTKQIVLLEAFAQFCYQEGYDDGHDAGYEAAILWERG